MTWLKLDDRLPTEPKMLALSDPAWRLHVSGMCYSSAHLTDGELDESAVRTMHPRAVKVAAELVTSGLWERTEKGWRIVGYLDTQRSAAEVEAIKEKKRAAGKKGGEAKAAAKQPPSTVLSEPAADDSYPAGVLSTADDHLLQNRRSSSSGPGHPHWAAIAKAGLIAARCKVPAPRNLDAFATTVARNIEREQGPYIAELLRLRPDLDLDALAYVLATDGAPKTIAAAKEMAELPPLEDFDDFDRADEIPAEVGATQEVRGA